ncbi:Cytochrome P450 94A2 [Camellia lanceoleosa]|uniref:Cytochrome P450 94A2 n=1 Tax=Camellia lanceoleosa TaxID=1840588 RepID=A0ACC0IXL2_9ERIC|nr:Cytochrome P450 94A2 [Camellia lanceoleosa]
MFRAEKQDQDLLSWFIRTDGNSVNSAERLQDIVINIILAGRDSMSSALTWFFWQLSSRPEIQILQELKTVRIRNAKCTGETYSFNELCKMKYLHAAISEAKKLDPLVPVDTKSCQDEDILLDSTVVKKHWFVMDHIPQEILMMEGTNNNNN